jgi:cold shock CspA family protein
VALTGQVTKLNYDRRFGFIAAPDGDYFFHATSLEQVDFATLVGGEAVEFDEAPSDRGPRAVRVRVVAR